MVERLAANLAVWYWQHDEPVGAAGMSGQARARADHRARCGAPARVSLSTAAQRGQGVAVLRLNATRGPRAAG